MRALLFPNRRARLGFVALGSFGFPLIVHLLAFGKSNFAFYPAAFQIHPGRDQGEAFFFSGALQFVDFAAVQQQLTRPDGRMVLPVAVAVFGDMSVEQPCLIRFSTEA